MTDRDKGVPRGDHNLDGADEAPRQSKPGESIDRSSDSADSADKRAHGTHGRGRGTEQRVDDAVVEPDTARGSERGAATWGSEGSGGSVIDKRGPKG